jgi:hypothetical protein
MVGVREIATTWLDFPCRMDLIQQPPVWAVFGDVACGQLKVQRQRCGGGVCEEHCLGVASVEDKHAACLPSLVSLECVQEGPLAGLKKLLDFSCMHSAWETPRKHLLCCTSSYIRFVFQFDS